MHSWISDIKFERHGTARRALKALVIDPVANYLPAGLFKAMLRFGKSELAAANWADPGGWRSMVISYGGRPKKLADRLLVGGGTMPMALRNRKRLGSRILARLIGESPSNPVHVLCLGAGPGQIITDAMLEAGRDARATLVDLSSDAFEYGRELARGKGLLEKMRFVIGDAREVKTMLDQAPDVVKMIGICEYLSDDQIVLIAQSVAAIMPAGGAIVCNSLSKAHGTDRFFRRVFGLHMNHRSPRQMQELMNQAGFAGFESVPEPLGVYHVIVGRRQK